VYRDESINDSDSDKSDVSTHKSDASRLSKSRTAASRSNKRKSAKRAEYLERCRQIFESEGRTFTKRDHAEVVAERRDPNRMLAPAPPIGKDLATVRGSAVQAMTAGQLVSCLLDRAGCVRANQWRRAFGLDEFRPESALKPVSAEDRRSVNARFLIKRNFTTFCKLCNKEGDEHVWSKGHMSRVDDQARMDKLVGPSSYPRLIDGRGYVPSKNVIDPDEATAYWGPWAHLMHRNVAARLKGKGFHVRLYSKTSKRFFVSADQISGLSSALVSYCHGEGRYGSKNYIRFWHELPCPDIRESGHSWWPVCLIAFKKQFMKNWAVPDDAPPEPQPKPCQVPLEEQPRKDPQVLPLGAAQDEVEMGEGGEDEEMEVEGEDDTSAAVATDAADEAVPAVGTKCLAICVKQGEEDEPDAWPISIRARM
jgi:hypothetical protein